MDQIPLTLTSKATPLLENPENSIFLRFFKYPLFVLSQGLQYLASFHTKQVQFATTPDQATKFRLDRPLGCRSVMTLTTDNGTQYLAHITTPINQDQDDSQVFQQAAIHIIDNNGTSADANMHDLPETDNVTSIYEQAQEHEQSIQLSHFEFERNHSSHLLQAYQSCIDKKTQLEEKLKDQDLKLQTILQSHHKQAEEYERAISEFRSQKDAAQEHVTALQSQLRELTNQVQTHTPEHLTNQNQTEFESLTKRFNALQLKHDKMILDQRRRTGQVLNSKLPLPADIALEWNSEVADDSLLMEMLVQRQVSPAQSIRLLQDLYIEAQHLVEARRLEIITQLGFKQTQDQEIPPQISRNISRMLQDTFDLWIKDLAHSDEAIRMFNEKEYPPELQEMVPTVLKIFCACHLTDPPITLASFKDDELVVGRLGGASYLDERAPVGSTNETYLCIPGLKLGQSELTSHKYVYIPNQEAFDI